MSPVATKRRRGSTRAASTTRRPLTSPNTTYEDLDATLIDIFNNSQHVTSSDQALNQLKKLYATTKFRDFEGPFMDCLKKLLQSEKSVQSIYFKTSCDFVCKFLQHVSVNLGDDRLVRSCCDVADHYMQIVDTDKRLNAVVFVRQILSHIESLDENICNALKITLPKRIRDKKPAIQAQAILASKKFQDHKMIDQAFRFHFDHDPELTVRKALVLTMDTEIFGYSFLADATQDSHEAIRKSAYFRLSKVAPKDLTLEQRHKIIHNGLYERERQAAFSFKTNTLDPWLARMYDGQDLPLLLRYFDVINLTDDVVKLLALIHEKDLDKTVGTATKLHHVVEHFHQHYLGSNNKCLPSVERLDQKIITVWLSLAKFCQKNVKNIKPVTLCTIQTASNDPNTSIGEILSSQDQNNEEIVELYERLTPDLVNLVGFVQRYVRHINEELNKDDPEPVCKYEFVYHKLMDFMSTYEIGDESERKTVQEVLGSILNENLLTYKFQDFIQPIVRCLQKLIYPTSSNLMLNYISELIHNIRSHLDDIGSELKDHPNELVKCLHMYNACLETVKVTEVPPIMINHLAHMSYASLCEDFKGDTRVRSLMVACNGITALLDKNYGQEERSTTLLISACLDENYPTPATKIAGFKALVDIIIQHDVKVRQGMLERFLDKQLKEYGKYCPKTVEKDELAFATCLVQGTMKLFYHQKLRSHEVLAHIIIWWYHPQTPSAITQFIGVALPMCIRHLCARRTSQEEDWFENLLAMTFVTSIAYLCDYILEPRNNSTMTEADMKDLINFLCNLVPISFHPRVHEVVDLEIDDNDRHPDLIKYLKQSKKSLKAAEATMLALGDKSTDDFDPIVKPLMGLPRLSR